MIKYPTLNTTSLDVAKLNLFNPFIQTLENDFEFDITLTKDKEYFTFEVDTEFADPIKKAFANVLMEVATKQLLTDSEGTLWDLGEGTYSLELGYEAYQKIGVHKGDFIFDGDFYSYNIR